MPQRCMCNSARQSLWGLLLCFSVALPVGCKATLPPSAAPGPTAPSRCLACGEEAALPQWLVVVADTGGLTPESLHLLRTTLRKELAVNTRALVVDGIASGRLDFIEIVSDVTGPRWINEDRSAAVGAVQEHLGEGAARGVAKHGARLTMTLNLRAAGPLLFDELDSSMTVDRQLMGTEVDVEAIKSSLEDEAVRGAAKDMASKLLRQVGIR